MEHVPGTSDEVTISHNATWFLSVGEDGEGIVDKHPRFRENVKMVRMISMR